MGFIKFIFTLSIILFSVASVHAEGNDLPFSVNADSFSYSENGDEFIAEGTVYVFSEDSSLKADKLIFNKVQDKIYANGNVVMLDKDLNTTYSDEIELTGDFKRGVAKSIVLMFEDTTGLLISDKAVKVNDEKVNFYDVEYTSCPMRKVDSTVPWKIKASKVTHNSEDDYVIYRNAVFSIYDIPVMYMPMFYHSTNTDKPVSGFLTPGLSSSSSDGFGFKTGYFWAIDDNQDATFRVHSLSKRGVIVGAEHRYVGEKFSSDIRIEGLEDKKKNKKARGLLTAEAEYVEKEGRRYGFNSVLASDENYLDEFKDVTDAYKYSTIYAEDASDSHYIGFSSRFYTDMRKDKDDDTLAQPVGRLEFEKLLDIDEHGGQFKFNGDVMSLIRQDGQDMNRLIGSAEYIKPFYTPDGSLFELVASARGDYYTYKNDINGEQSESRVLPELAISWEKPFVSGDFKHILTPKMMFITSPEKDFSNIPNEDSTSFELDATNLFEKNRYSGLDRVETGTRLVYGVDTKYGDPRMMNLHAFIGQSYNFSTKKGTSSGSSNNVEDDKNSDWVGFVKIEPNEHITAGTNFRLNNSSFGAQRIDSYVTLKKQSKFYSLDKLIEDDYIRLVHSFLKDDSEEVNLYTLYNVNEDYAVKTRIQRNMYENITLTQEIELLYKSCCYNLSFKVRKKQTNDTDKEDSLDFLVNYGILPMGRQ